ncbi:MAG: penicillin-binding transpeptidase domain-containing protein [Acidimicrobiia bacterium]
MRSPGTPRRLTALGIAGVLLLGGLTTRMWFLQTVSSRDVEEVISQVRTRTIKLLPERGRIFDAAGRVMADNRRTLVVTLDQTVLRRATVRLELAQRLSGPLNVPIATLLDRMTDERYGPYDAVPLREGVSEDTALFLMERKQDYPGLYVREEWRRTYPYGAVGGHVVGYLGAILRENLAYYRSLGYDPNERVGQYGVEQHYETALRGTPGYVRYEVDAIGNILRVLERVEPISGKDLLLSLDLGLQQFVEQALETQLLVRRRVAAGEVRLPDGTLDPQYEPVNYYKAPAGSAVVLNHRTGEVVAMASYPRFDPRWFGGGVSRERFGLVFPRTEDPDLSILVNRAVSGRYNVGSSLKPFVAYAALNTGQLPGGASYVFDDRGTYKLESIPEDRCQQGVKCVFRNSVCRATGAPCRYGRVDVEAALAVSSDTFFYKIGEQILTERGYAPVLEEQMRLFGFGSPTNVDLPYEYAGTVPSKELKRRLADIGAISEESGSAYYVGDQVLFAIGQGLFSATPLQMANAYAAIANRGRVFEPRVGKALLAPGTPNVRPGWVSVGRAERVAELGDREPETIPMGAGVRDPIVDGLQRVVTGPGVDFDYYHRATGENLFRNYPHDDLPIGGKTGTAQGFKNLPWNDSSAFGAISLSALRPYTVYAYLEKAGYGSQAAAPVVKCVFTALSGRYRFDAVLQADPLDVNALEPAPRMNLRNPTCLASVASEGRE